MRKCKYCGSDYELKEVPWKKRIFSKPTGNDWFILLIILLVLFTGYRYNLETKECRRIVSERHIDIERIENITFNYYREKFGECNPLALEADYSNITFDFVQPYHK